MVQLHPLPHNNKESVDDGLYDSDEVKEDSNNDSDAEDFNYPDNDPSDDDRSYTNPEEEQNPKLRAIQSVRRNKKRESKGKKEYQPKELEKVQEHIYVLHHKIILFEYFILQKKLIVIQ